MIDATKESQKEIAQLEASVKKDHAALDKRQKALQKEEEEADLEQTGEAQRIFEEHKKEEEERHNAEAARAERERLAAIKRLQEENNISDKDKYVQLAQSLAQHKQPRHRFSPRSPLSCALACRTSQVLDEERDENVCEQEGGGGADAAVDALLAECARDASKGLRLGLRDPRIHERCAQVYQRICVCVCVVAANCWEAYVCSVHV